MMIFFLFIVGTNINKLFKKYVKDTLLRQYSYKIELADNSPPHTPPLNMLKRFLSLEPDFADNMRATAALTLSASNWGG
jgi:hypothetical protein